MTRKPSRSTARKRPPRAKRLDVTRGEFERLRSDHDDLREDEAGHRADLDLQFKRFAQIQAELEDLQRAVRKLQKS